MDAKTSMKMRNRNRKLLLQAISKKDVQAVRQLLENDPDAIVTTHKKETLLHKALCLNTSVQVIEELFHHGADLHALDSERNTPLHISVTYGENTTCVKLLLNRGSNPNAINRRKETPLHLLGSKSNAEIAKVLLHHGANVEAVDCLTETALHKVLFSKNIGVIQELLGYGADIHRANSLGVTPLRIAMRHVPLAEFLVKHALIHTFKGDSSNLFNLDAYSESRNYDAVAIYFKRCILELVKMNTMKFNDHLSLHAFVTTKNPNALSFPEDEHTRTVARKKKLVANFPIYSDVILSRLDYAWERAMLLEKVNKMVLYSRHHCDSTKGFREKIVLNYDCTFFITKNIWNDDLCNLMLAFYNSNLYGSESLPTATGSQKGELGKRFLDSPTSSCSKEARLK